jgi:hypothetical protein
MQLSVQLLHDGTRLPLCNENDEKGAHSAQVFLALDT